MVINLFGLLLPTVSMTCYLILFGLFLNTVFFKYPTFFSLKYNYISGHHSCYFLLFLNYWNKIMSQIETQNVRKNMSFNIMWWLSQLLIKCIFVYWFFNCGWSIRLNGCIYVLWIHADVQLHAYYDVVNKIVYWKLIFRFLICLHCRQF